MINIKTAVPLLLTGFLLISCGGSDSQTESKNPSISDTTMVDLWNGNRSQIRQVYEKEVLTAVLQATEDEVF